MRLLKGVAGLALVAAMVAPAAQAQYDQRLSDVRSFEQKAGGSGAQVSGNLRGISVNKNVGSPYYGYVYICDLARVATGQTDVLIYKPVGDSPGTAGTKYVDTGKKILVNTDKSQFPSSFQGGHGVSVGPDDTVWICDFSARQIESAPPVPPGEDATVVATPVINLAEHDAAALSELPPDNGWVVGNPRNLHVARTQTESGPVDVLLVSTNTGDSSATDNTIQKYTLTKSEGTYTGTYQWTRPIADLDNDPAINDNQNGTGYDVTCDENGNVYIPLRAASGEVVIRKLNPAGSVVPFANPPVSPFKWFGANETGEQNVSVDANFPGIAYVQDATVPGGGYLYWAGKTGNDEHGGLYDLTGNLIIALGRNFRYNPVSGNVLGYVEADDTGNLYARLGNGSTNANFAKVFNAKPFVSTAAAINGQMSSPATTADGVTYFGGTDGKIYAIENATGAAPAGTSFPVSITDTGGVVLGRIAVRDLGAGPFLYFTTNNGCVGRLPISGDSSAPAGAWITDPLLTATDAAVTPAVTNDGILYVALGDGSSASLFRLDALTGTTTGSQALGATAVKSSPSVANNNIYVGTDAGTYRVLDSGSGFVVSATAGGATNGSPFVHLNSPNGPAVYAVDNNGLVSARNAVNFNPVAAFGAVGEVPLGAAVHASLYAHNNVLYIGGMDNKVYAVNEADGSGAGASGYVFFDAGAGGGIAAGVAVSPATSPVNANDPGGDSVIFGSTNGRYYQVRVNDPMVYRAYPAALSAVTFAAGNFPDPLALITAPSVDRAMAGPNGPVATEFIGDADGRVYRIPGL